MIDEHFLGRGKIEPTILFEVCAYTPLILYMYENASCQNSTENETAAEFYNIRSFGTNLQHSTYTFHFGRYAIFLLAFCFRLRLPRFRVRWKISTGFNRFSTSLSPIALFLPFDKNGGNFEFFSFLATRWDT